MNKKKVLLALLVVLLITNNFLIARPAFASGEATTKISVNTVYQGTVQSNGAVYYSFTLPSDGNVTLSMLRNSQNSWSVELTDLNGNQLEYFNTSNGTLASGNEERQVGLPKGSYYLKISNYSYGNVTPYKFQVKFSAGSGYEKELNDTMETSNFIQLNKLYKGALQDSNDRDYYAFTTPADGNVTLSIKRNTKCSWYMTLYSASGDVYYTTFNTSYGTTTTGQEVREVGLPKGKYVVAIENYTGSSDIGYEFQAKFTTGNQYEKEDNDSLDKANVIQLNKAYQGVLQSSIDSDFFTFSQPSDGNITLSIKQNAKCSWYMTLYSADGVVYKEFNTAYGSTATGSKEIPIGLPKGNYIVKISNYTSTQDVPYVFQVKYSAGSYYEKENNDSFDSANPISLNAVYKGSLQGYSDEDTFSFTLAKTQQVRVSIPRQSGVSWYSELLNEDGSSIGYFNTSYGSSVTGNEVRTYILAPGHYYMVMSNYTSTTDVPYEFALWTASPQITPEQVAVSNNKGKTDSITVGGLGTKDVVKVYNTSKGGKPIAISAKAPSTGKVTMSITQIGQKAGTLYVTVTKPGWTESLRIPVTFSGEQSNPLLAGQVKTENNKGKPDVMTINGLGTGDIVNVYNTAGKLIGVSMPATNGQAAIAFVQLGTTTGKVNVTVTRAGMTESAKTAITFHGESTTALVTSQTAIVNNKKISDTITVKALQKGDVIRIYDLNGKYLTSKTAASSLVTVTIKQLGTSAGYVYVTNTRTGMTEGVKTKVSYKAE